MSLDPIKDRNIYFEDIRTIFSRESRQESDLIKEGIEEKTLEEFLEAIFEKKDESLINSLINLINELVDYVLKVKWMVIILN